MCNNNINRKWWGGGEVMEWLVCFIMFRNINIITKRMLDLRSCSSANIRPAASLKPLIYWESPKQIFSVTFLNRFLTITTLSLYSLQSRPICEKVKQKSVCRYKMVKNCTILFKPYTN